MSRILIIWINLYKCDDVRDDMGEGGFSCTRPQSKDPF